MLSLQLHDSLQLHTHSSLLSPQSLSSKLDFSLVLTYAPWSIAPCYVSHKPIESNTILIRTTFVTLRTSQALFESHIEITTWALLFDFNRHATPHLRPYFLLALTNQITPVSSANIHCLYFLSIQPLKIRSTIPFIRIYQHMQFELIHVSTLLEAHKLL